MSLNNLAPTGLVTTLLIGDTRAYGASPVLTRNAQGVPVSAALELQSKSGILLNSRLKGTEAEALASVVDGMSTYISEAGGGFATVGFYGRVNNAWISLNGGGSGAPVNNDYVVCTNTTGLPNAKLLDNLPLTPNGSLAIGNNINIAGGQNFVTGINCYNTGCLGVDNVIVGKDILTFADSCSSTTAIGWGAMKGSNGPARTSLRDTAIGAQALFFSINTADCVSIGNSSLPVLTIGQSNCSLGSGSGFNLNQGNGNTFLGADTKTFAIGGMLQNATAIGASCVINRNNCVNIGAGALVGINAPYPDAALHIENTGSGSFQFPNAAIFMKDSLNPPLITPDSSNGGFLYVQGGGLKYMGSGGTITQLAPA